MRPTAPRPTSPPPKPRSIRHAPRWLPRSHSTTSICAPRSSASSSLVPTSTARAKPYRSPNGVHSPDSPARSTSTRHAPHWNKRARRFPASKAHAPRPNITSPCSSAVPPAACTNRLPRPDRCPWRRAKSPSASRPTRCVNAPTCAPPSSRYRPRSRAAPNAKPTATRASHSPAPSAGRRSAPPRWAVPTALFPRWSAAWPGRCSTAAASQAALPCRTRCRSRR